MKEAAGEANMTVITIVLIAVVLGVGLILVPNMMNKTSRSACCTNSGYVWDKTNNQCYQHCNLNANGQASGCTSPTSPACNDK